MNATVHERQLLLSLRHVRRATRSAILYDRFTHRDRIALETCRDARTAALIREAVQDCAPPGSDA